MTTEKELLISPTLSIADVAKTISSQVGEDAIKKGNDFTNEIENRFISDFEKTGDKMAHVSTFVVIGDMVYMTYYANTKEPSEDPKNQTARLVYANIHDIENKTFMDLQTIGDRVGDKTIDMVYDTILMQKDNNTIYIMWTARLTEGNYYRFYCPFDLTTKSLGEIGVNRFKVGNTVNDFSFSGIQNALAREGVPCKKMFSDIGIMQKLSSRVENGVTYYYTGTYSGDFIWYKGNLYLFHAPIDREHIGTIKINIHDITKSEVVLQARMHTSCFYPFVQYFTDGELAMSYTVSRQHIRLARFTLSDYL